MQNKNPKYNLFKDENKKEYILVAVEYEDVTKSRTTRDLRHQRNFINGVSIISPIMSELPRTAIINIKETRFYINEQNKVTQKLNNYQDIYAYKKDLNDRYLDYEHQPTITDELIDKSLKAFKEKQTKKEVKKEPEAIIKKEQKEQPKQEDKYKKVGITHTKGSEYLMKQNNQNALKKIKENHGKDIKSIKIQHKESDILPDKNQMNNAKTIDPNRPVNLDKLKINSVDLKNLKIPSAKAKEKQTSAKNQVGQNGQPSYQIKHNGLQPLPDKRKK